MDVDMGILQEALLRAQYAGRDVPCLSDFPSSVSAKDVEEHYLPHLAAEEAIVRQGFSAGPVKIIGYNGAASTVAGDAIASALRLSAILSIDT